MKKLDINLDTLCVDLSPIFKKHAISKKLIEPFVYYYFEEMLQLAKVAEESVFASNAYVNKIQKEFDKLNCKENIVPLNTHQVKWFFYYFILTAVNNAAITKMESILLMHFMEHILSSADWDDKEDWKIAKIEADKHIFSNEKLHQAIRSFCTTLGIDKDETIY